MKYSLKRQLLQESTHEEKLAKLLVSPVPQAVQGAQLGEPLDLVKDFQHHPLPFDEAEIVTVKTPPTLADELRKHAESWQHLTQIPQPDGWVESSYAIAER